MKNPSMVLAALLALTSFGCGSNKNSGPTAAKIGGYTFSLNNFTSSASTANPNDEAIILVASDGNTCALLNSISAGDDAVLDNLKGMTLVFGVGDAQGFSALPTAVGDYPVVFSDSTGTQPVGNYANLRFGVDSADGKTDALHPDSQTTAAQAGDGVSGTLKVTALPASGSDGPVKATLTAVVGPQKDSFQASFEATGCHVVQVQPTDGQ